MNDIIQTSRASIVTHGLLQFAGTDLTLRAWIELDWNLRIAVRKGRKDFIFLTLTGIGAPWKYTPLPPPIVMDVNCFEPY